MLRNGYRSCSFHTDPNAPCLPGRHNFRDIELKNLSTCYVMDKIDLLAYKTYTKCHDIRFY